MLNPAQLAKIFASLSERRIGRVEDKDPFVDIPLPEISPFYPHVIFKLTVKFTNPVQLVFSAFDMVVRSSHPLALWEEFGDADYEAVNAIIYYFKSVFPDWEIELSKTELRCTSKNLTQLMKEFQEFPSSNSRRAITNKLRAFVQLGTLVSWAVAPDLRPENKAD